MLKGKVNELDFCEALMDDVLQRKHQDVVGLFSTYDSSTDEQKKAINEVVRHLTGQTLDGLIAEHVISTVSAKFATSIGSGSQCNLYYDGENFIQTERIDNANSLLVATSDEFDGDRELAVYNVLLERCKKFLTVTP